MRLLAIESSTSLPSCALWLDGKLIERVCPADRNSSETLLPAIMALLAEYGIGLAGLDGIAFGAGPGSFTGVRVAAALTQGLAFAADRPVVPVETLAAVAWASGADAALAMLDARMHEIYAGTYRRIGGRLHREGDLQVATAAALVLPDSAGEWTVCGNAVAVYPDLADRLAGWPAVAAALPGAAAIAELGCHVLVDGGGLPPDLAQPLYVRDKVALTTAERLARGGKA